MKKNKTHPNKFFQKSILLIYMTLIPVVVNAQLFQPLQLPNPLSLLSKIFSPKQSNFAKLIEEKKFVEADDFIGAEKNYFLVENKNENIDQLKILALAFNENFELKIDELTPIFTQTIDSNENGWASYKEALIKFEKIANDYYKLNIFSDKEFQTKKITILQSLISSWKTVAENYAPVAFQKFNHQSGLSFFENYPHELSIDFLESNASLLENYINDLSFEQIAALKTKYSKYITPNKKFDELLSASYVKSSLTEASAPHSLSKILNLIKNAKSIGLEIKSIPNNKISFIEATSKTLISEGQIEFPTQIVMDLPFEPQKSELESVFNEAASSNAKTIIVLDVAFSKVSRRIIAKNDIDSKFVSGSRSEPNPQYDIARSKMFEAQAGLVNAQSTYASGLAAAILKGIAVGSWQSQVNDAQRLIQNTPTTIQKDEFQNYKYSASDVVAAKNLTANYYVLNKNTNQYYKGTFDISENKSFKIAYNLHDRDPEKGTIINRFHKESDLSGYEKSPMTLPISALIDDYLKNESKSKPIQSIIALKEEMLVDKNKALSSYKNNQFDAKPINDPRFESVVVINNPKGAIGTGFFVSPDLILTNYHVIEGVQFLEMKLYNGMETFGKVVKSDVRLDLALIKVQTRGVPVNFYKSNTLDLGATVEAIGHPKGLTFTITRGIVSAIRKRPSIFGIGGKEVLFVQTDAAINPGNSGGPLFLADKVIGVNNNKMVSGSEGLGFSIHYSEVNEFLKESF